jgi:hypothetical protein
MKEVEVDLMNEVWSEAACVNPCVKRNVVSFSDHCLLAYLRPYNDFMSLQTCPGLGEITP